MLRMLGNLVQRGTDLRCGAKEIGAGQPHHNAVALGRIILGAVVQPGALRHAVDKDEAAQQVGKAANIAPDRDDLGQEFRGLGGDWHGQRQVIWPNRTPAARACQLRLRWRVGRAVIQRSACGALCLSCLWSATNRRGKPPAGIFEDR